MMIKLWVFYSEAFPAQLCFRDLDLKVELQERWTGEKIKITESFVETEGVH